VTVQPARFAHVPAVTERADGTWGVYCPACSDEAQDYVPRCKVRDDWPPLVLVAAESDDEMHVIDLRANGWTIKHPLSCRPKLFDCAVNRAAERSLTEPPNALGRFECWVDDHGFHISTEPLHTEPPDA
jgi:hypothetical protein